jgi:hypothetical protein
MTWRPFCSPENHAIFCRPSRPAEKADDDAHRPRRIGACAHPILCVQVRPAWSIFRNALNSATVHGYKSARRAIRFCRRVTRKASFPAIGDVRRNLPPAIDIVRLSWPCREVRALPLPPRSDLRAQPTLCARSFANRSGRTTMPRRRCCKRPHLRVLAETRRP